MNETVQEEAPQHLSNVFDNNNIADHGFDGDDLMSKSKFVHERQTSTMDIDPRRPTVTTKIPGLSIERPREVKNETSKSILGHEKQTSTKNFRVRHSTMAGMGKQGSRLATSQNPPSRSKSANLGEEGVFTTAGSAAAESFSSTGQKLSTAIGTGGSMAASNGGASSDMTKSAAASAQLGNSQAGNNSLMWRKVKTAVKIAGAIGRISKETDRARRYRIKRHWDLVRHIAR